MIKIGDIIYVKYSNKRVAVPVVIVAEVNTGGVEFMETGSMNFDEDILNWYKDCAITELSTSALRNGIKSIITDENLEVSQRIIKVAEATLEPVFLYAEVSYLEDDTLDWGEMRGDTYGALKSVLEEMNVKSLEILN